MQIRRVTMLEEMFQDVASREEKLKVDELYSRGNKGSAIVFMLKRIRKQWNIFTGKSQTDMTESNPRVIKINENGQTRLVARL